ncbi:hypothetical protein Q5752_003093 [Cryptotrichosporon argae]
MGTYADEVAAATRSFPPKLSATARPFTASSDVERDAPPTRHCQRTPVTKDLVPTRQPSRNIERGEDVPQSRGYVPPVTRPDYSTIDIEAKMSQMRLRHEREEAHRLAALQEEVEYKKFSERERAAYEHRERREREARGENEHYHHEAVERKLAECTEWDADKNVEERVGRTQSSQRGAPTIDEEIARVPSRPSRGRVSRYYEDDDDSDDNYHEVRRPSRRSAVPSPDRVARRVPSQLKLYRREYRESRDPYDDRDDHVYGRTRNERGHATHQRRRDYPSYRDEPLYDEEDVDYKCYDLRYHRPRERSLRDEEDDKHRRLDYRRERFGQDDDEELQAPDILATQPLGARARDSPVSIKRPVDNGHEIRRDIAFPTKPFSSGYGIRHAHPKDDTLPPEEERIGPDGERHRTYPAPAPVGTINNYDSGWPEPAPEPPNIEKPSRTDSTSAKGIQRPTCPTPVRQLEQHGQDDAATNDREDVGWGVSDVKVPVVAKPVPTASALMPAASTRANDGWDVTETGTPREIKSVRTPNANAGVSQGDGSYGGWQPVVYVDPEAKARTDEELNRRMEERWRNRNDFSAARPRDGARAPASGIVAKDIGGASRQRDSGWGARAAVGASNNMGSDQHRTPSGHAANDGGWGTTDDAKDTQAASGWDNAGGADGFGSSGSQTASRGYARAGGGRGGGKFDGDGCRRCGASGHWAKECTKEEVCFRCNKSGHRSYDCDHPRNTSCFNCGEDGHTSRDCPNRDGGGGGGYSGGGFGGGGMVCYDCDQPGHKAADCSEPLKQEKFRDDCLNCGEPRHMRANCSQDRRPHPFGSYGGLNGNGAPYSAGRNEWGSDGGNKPAHNNGWGDVSSAREAADDGDVTFDSSASRPPAPEIHPDRLKMMSSGRATSTRRRAPEPAHAPAGAGNGRAGRGIAAPESGQRQSWVNRQKQADPEPQFANAVEGDTGGW